MGSDSPSFPTVGRITTSPTNENTSSIQNDDTTNNNRTTITMAKESDILMMMTSTTSRQQDVVVVAPPPVSAPSPSDDLYYRSESSSEEGVVLERTGLRSAFEALDHRQRVGIGGPLMTNWHGMPKQPSGAEERATERLEGEGVLAESPIGEILTNSLPTTKQPIHPVATRYAPTVTNQPCRYTFRRGDRMWFCIDCRRTNEDDDEDDDCGYACLCDSCFLNGDHAGHEISYELLGPGPPLPPPRLGSSAQQRRRSSGGGSVEEEEGEGSENDDNDAVVAFCDCGDEELWKTRGCCVAHRPIPKSSLASAAAEGVDIEGMLQEKLRLVTNSEERSLGDGNDAAENDEQPDRDETTVTSNPNDYPCHYNPAHPQSPLSPISTDQLPCGYTFAPGDRMWFCYDCVANDGNDDDDDSGGGGYDACLCDSCFLNSNHDGHEVRYELAPARRPRGILEDGGGGGGGEGIDEESEEEDAFCDCGDPDLWKVEGCCAYHKPVVTGGDDRVDGVNILQE